jgi:hypothetical protein
VLLKEDQKKEDIIDGKCDTHERNIKFVDGYGEEI